MDFAVGDVVVLKSGGPRMTIAALEDDEAVCVWVEKNRTFRERFELVILKKYAAGGPISVRTIRG